MPLKTRKALWRLILAVALCVGCIGLVPRSYADAAKFTYTDKETGVTVPEKKFVLSGSSLLWLDRDDAGWY